MSTLFPQLFNSGDDEDDESDDDDFQPGEKGSNDPVQGFGAKKKIAKEPVPKKVVAPKKAAPKKKPAPPPAPAAPAYVIYTGES